MPDHKTYSFSLFRTLLLLSGWPESEVVWGLLAAAVRVECELLLL